METSDLLQVAAESMDCLADLAQPELRPVFEDAAAIFEEAVIDLESSEAARAAQLSQNATL